MNTLSDLIQKATVDAERTSEFLAAVADSDIKGVLAGMLAGCNPALALKVLIDGGQVEFLEALLEYINYRDRINLEIVNSAMSYAVQNGQFEAANYIAQYLIMYDDGDYLSDCSDS